MNSTSTNESTLNVSVVIPVYNEESILRESVLQLLSDMRALSPSFELIIAENGSSDATPQIAQSLTENIAEVHWMHVEEANYGAALRQGIMRAKGDYVICEEIDLCDAAFHKSALELLEAEHADMVIGSKAMSGARDARPWIRKTATRIINLLLRIMLGFRGTDTHGLKAFKREALLPIAHACIVDRDLFASEFVIRAERSGLSIKEIPITIHEKRPPSVHLFRRVPDVLKNLMRLVIAIRFKG